MRLQIRIVKLLLLPLAILFLGTESFGSTNAGPDSRLSLTECRKLFVWADHCSWQTELDGVVYATVWDDESFPLGYAFKNILSLVKSEASLLVGVDEDGRIAKVWLSGVQLAPQFFAQFKGRGLEDSFELVRTPADLLFVPAKIKPVEKHVEVCEIIAKEVKGILQLWRRIQNKSK